MEEPISSPQVEEQAPAMSPKKEAMEGPSSSPLRSPDNNSCAICLGTLENKCLADSCFHEFCFSCLLEWSKIKAECPLCKQPFKSIIHNIKSDCDYEKHYLRQEMPWENLRAQLFVEMPRQYMQRFGPARQSFYFPPFNTLRAPAVTSGFRRHIYEDNLWVEPTTSSRYRETSPLFFQENPACTHRLIPWLNRELVALFFMENESRVNTVMDMILELIQCFDILSPEFHIHLEPFLLQNTNHFIHEFYNFARSPYDLEAYDQKSKYKKNTPTFENTFSSTWHSRRRSPLSRKRNVITLRRVRAPSSSSSLTSSPSHTPNYEVVDNTPDTTPVLDLASGLPGSSSMNYAPPSPAYSSHSSDCVIVDYVTPPVEVIDIISSSDTEIDVTTLPSTSANPPRSKPSSSGLNYKRITTPLRKKRKTKAPVYYYDSSDSSDFGYNSFKPKKRRPIDSDEEEEEEETFHHHKKITRVVDSSSDEENFFPRKIPSVVKKVSKSSEDSKCKKHKKHKKHKHSKQKYSKMGSK